MCLFLVTSPTSYLIQLGPRLTLQLVKVEAGLCEGEVLHHAFSEYSRLLRLLSLSPSLFLSLSVLMLNRRVLAFMQFIEVRRNGKL